MFYNLSKNKKGFGKLMVMAYDDEKSNYDYKTGKSINGQTVGNFTQMIWKGSKEFGAGICQWMDTDTNKFNM